MSSEPALEMKEIPFRPLDRTPSSSSSSGSGSIPCLSPLPTYDVVLHKTSSSWDQVRDLSHLRRHVQIRYRPVSSVIQAPKIRLQFRHLYEAVAFVRNHDQDPVLSDPRYGIQMELDCGKENEDDQYPETESSSEEEDKDKDQDREGGSSGYFRSYGRLSIHRAMIQDRARTLTYQKAIQERGYLFRDKVVLDVGCGTGILSLFAAKAGASKVFAVDQSEAVVHLAKRVVRDNGLEDVITVIEGLVEEIDLPGVEAVDIIISEWMGYCLVYENMLKSVLFARDKWLSPAEGKMFPDVANLYLCGWYSPGSHASRFEWMSRFWGWNFRHRSKTIWEEVTICDVTPDEVGTHPVLIKHLSLEACSIEESSLVDTEFCLELIDSDYNVVYGLIIYFDVLFRHSSVGKEVTLTTSPFEELTHWKQAVLHFENPLTLSSDFPRLLGKIKCFTGQARKGRGLKIQVQVRRENDPESAKTEIRNYFIK